jgi:hypothetical protein
MELTTTNSTTAMQNGEKIEIRIARSLPEVEALRELWMAWPSHRDSDIDFFLMIVQSYPEVLRPHVIALYRDGEPTAIMVGRLEKKRLAFNIGYLRVFGPSARCLTFVYGAIHGDASPENTEILLREVMRSLKQKEADIAMLEFVPLDSPLYRLGLKLPGTFARDTLPAAQPHDLMLIPDSIDKIYGRMSSKHRKNLRREVRRLFAEGESTRIVCYRSESDLDRLFHDAEEIAQKTYQRGLAAGFADNPQVRQRLALAAQKGWLRAHLLYIGDRPVTFWIGMLYNGTFVSEYMGYDPEFRQFSPGMVLILRVIEGFCNRANGDIIKELDFGLGHAEYKETLCSKNWLEAAVYMFSPSLKGIVLKSMRSTTRAADASARRVLILTRFLPRLKRAWRDRLAKGTKLPPDLKKFDTSAIPRPTIHPETNS